VRIQLASRKPRPSEEEFKFGLGVMTKYTIAFCAVGIVAGVFLTRTRRHLFTPWLWGGVALSLLIFLPNLIWQISHDFISLEFLSNIHERDIAWGRTSSYLVEQLFLTASGVGTQRHFAKSRANMS